MTRQRSWRETELHRGAHFRDAASVSQFGKVATPVAGFVGLATEVTNMIAEHESFSGKGSELIAIGALSIAGYLGFDKLQSHFTSQADRIFRR